jgi:flagellar protein FliT
MSHMLIDYYKAIEDSSAKMLEAAKLKDWDGVVRYDAQIRCLAEPWLAQFEHLFEGQPQMMH